MNENEVLLPAVQVQNLGCGRMRMAIRGCESMLYDVDQIFVTTTACGLVYVDIRGAALVKS